MKLSECLPSRALAVIVFNNELKKRMSSFHSTSIHVTNNAADCGLAEELPNIISVSNYCRDLISPILQRRELRCFTRDYSRTLKCWTIHVLSPGTALFLKKTFRAHLHWVSTNFELRNALFFGLCFFCYCYSRYFRADNELHSGPCCWRHLAISRSGCLISTCLLIQFFWTGWTRSSACMTCRKLPSQLRETSTSPSVKAAYGQAGGPEYLDSSHTDLNDI